MAARVSKTFDIWTPISRGPSAMGFTLDNTLGVTSAPVGRSVAPENIGPLWRDSRAPPKPPWSAQQLFIKFVVPTVVWFQKAT